MGIAAENSVKEKLKQKGEQNQSKVKVHLRSKPSAIHSCINAQHRPIHGDRL